MANGSRSLRVGVVLAGQLVEERVFCGPVSLGQSLRCALSVPVDGIPREHLLVSRDEGRYVLHVPAGMTGRVGAKDGLVEVAAGQTVTLERGARGKLVAGDATILFQEIATPPAAPRPRLPASIRGTLADRIDRRLTAIIGGSLLVHVALAAYAWMGDVEEHVLGAPPVAMYHQDVIDVQLPDLVEPTPLDPVPSEPGAATPAAPQHQTPRPIVTRPSSPSASPQAVDSQRLASILTGGDGETGLGGMGSRQPGADLGKQIDDARNKQITIGDGGHTSRVDDRARPGTVDERPIASTPQQITHDTRRDSNEPTGRIVPGVVEQDDTTTLTPAMVLERINTVYMAGLQRCYRLGLANDSQLAGRVKISFTVDARGKVVDGDASGVSSQVDGCIGTAMTGWRFPIPKQDGKPTEAAFTVSLALQPS